MSVNAIIPAAVHSSMSTHNHQPESHSTTSQQPQSYEPSIVKSGNGLTIDQLRAESYTHGSNSSNSPRGSRRTSPSKIKDSQDDEYDEDSEEGNADNGILNENGDDIQEDTDSEDGSDVFGMEPEIPVTWRYMSRLYLLVPIITLVWLALLTLLVTFAWPPSKGEREAGQKYPHPILFKPFIIGIFASCTVQILRVPIWVVISWFRFSQGQTTFWSTSLHAIIHELLRLSTLPLITISPTSGFHSSYYLGLGWGVAEVTWGIIQGWEQIELYKEVMRPSNPPRLLVGPNDTQINVHIDIEAQGQVLNRDHGQNESGDIKKGNRKTEGMLSSVIERSDEDDDDQVVQDDDDDDDEEEEERREEDEDELERKVEILERMRARRDLEEVLGIPFPNIPFPLHLLWRLDTLLLNLGLTLLLSSFYFNSAPIYRHAPWTTTISRDASIPDTEPHKWLWQVWALVSLVHVGVSLVWKVVGRVGIGAVTWGGLIVALGSVFAGLGCWGGLV
ncbi:uncharacterized protein IL334_007203 [Kwoniella shivajii]|uniref:Uncharacterized protein n=1 Tax=Kwoniella shivajii TaxID=564305 RepID=A0ABZ1D812_9TREE|nr:hypothetical protein IL334_007203 [Kwoniella shivajii]